MPKKQKSKPPMGEMAYATAFIAMLGLAQAYYSFHFQSWKRAITSVVLLALASGIWYRLRFARLGAVAVLALGALVLLNDTLRHEMTFNRLAWIAAVLWCCWVIGRGYENETADPTDDAERHRESVAFIALLDRAVAIDEAAVKRVLGTDASVFGGGMFWAVRTPAGVLRVSAVARPFFADHSASTTHADERRAVREHNAWIGVEVADPETADLAAAYPLMGRLLAAIAPENSLVIHATATNEFFACAEDWRERFRENPPFQIPRIAAAPKPPETQQPPAAT